MGILNVDNIQPVGGGTTITLNSSEINVGTGVTFESNGQANFAGVVTATSFVGDGSGLTGAGPTLTNGSNNRVVTATGANGINGEANLTFDGSNVIHAGGDGRRYSFAGGGSSHYMKFDSTLNGIILNGYGGIAFETNGTNERLRIGTSGQIGLSGANYGTSGQVLTSQGASSAVQWATPSSFPTHIDIWRITSDCLLYTSPSPRDS